MESASGIIKKLKGWDNSEIDRPKLPTIFKVYKNLAVRK